MSERESQHPEHHDDIHHHHHGHHGAVKNIRVAFFLNLAFALIELVGGLLTNSMAILSDALHDLGDSFSLGLSWYLEKVSARRSDQKYTYGYARFSVLAALINSLILIGGSIFILTEAIPRLVHPEQSNAKGMLILALIGLAVNGFAAWRLMRGETLNERAVALHLLEDVLGWVAVLIGSIVMLFFDVPVLDPVLSIAIMAYVLYNVVRNLRKSIHIFLQGSPSTIHPSKLEHSLQHLPGIVDIHDLHIWTLDGQYHIATMHVVVKSTGNWEENEQIKAAIREKMVAAGIVHTTVELEPEGYECAFQACSGPKIEAHGHHDHHHH